MVNKRKLNFRIVEVSDSDRNYDKYYDDFRKDYLNPVISVAELKKKYPIPPYVYREWAKGIREEEGLWKKPSLYYSPLLKPHIHIYELSDGWGIRKKLNGEMQYFGRYKDLETAMFVRNKLVEVNWDDEVADELIKKYGFIKNLKIKPDELILKYDEFKHLYLDKPTKYQDIMKQLGINAHSYNWLLHKLREEYGKDIKKNKLRCYDPNYFTKKKPDELKGSKIKQRPMRHIRKNSKGLYEIVKVINGKQTYFGAYRLLESARNRRNKLEANGWVK